MQDFFSIGFYDTLIRFAVCILVNWSIVHFLYFRKSHRRDFYFTFVIISIAIFFLVYLMMGMDRGKATMGVGLGLFGIFSIMRYRTDTMPVREMTYLFVVVCLSVVHAMAVSLGVDSEGQMLGTPLPELIAIDVIVFIGIKGERGVGKTTMLLQRIKEKYSNPDDTFYISLDHYWFGTHQLQDLIAFLYKRGITEFYIDEVHKYKGWSTILKNLVDQYKA